MSRPPRSPRWGAAIAGWELTRLARRGSPTIARLLVGLLLIAALLVTYLAAFPRDLDLIEQNKIQARLSSFGQDFALTLLLVQAAVVLLLTPLFVVGAIVEEAERRTLEFLLATDLSAREIILGKLWPRILLMVGIVLVGWPVLAVTQVWGGVDIVFVCLASLIVIAFIWAISGISAACAVGAKSLRKAMFRAYGFSFAALMLFVINCPFASIFFLAKTEPILADFQDTARTSRSRTPVPPPIDPTLPRILAVAVPIATHLLIGLWGIRRACYKLRHARYFYARMPWQEKPRKPQKWEQHPPVPQGSPLLWKEIHLSGQTARIVRLMNLVPTVVWLCVSCAFMMVGLVFALAIDEANNVLNSMNQAVRWGGGALVGLMALMVGLHAAGSVARERQQETLVDLLAIPRPRREILWAKWVGSLAKVRGIALGTAAVPLVAYIADGLSLWAAFLLVPAAAAILACAASFGLWLSVRTQTIQRASGLWMLLVGLWVGGTFLAAQAAYVQQQDRYWMLRSNSPKPPDPLVWDRILNPALAWSQLTFRFWPEELQRTYYSPRDSADGEISDLSEVIPSLAGIMVLGLFAWLLYLWAGKRFEREGLS